MAPDHQSGIPLIELREASLVYGSQTVLDRLNWRLWPGQHWALVGHNGAGKTSLLRLLRGEIRPYYQEQGAPPAISWGFDGVQDASPLAVRPISSLLSSELQRHYVRQGWRLTGEDVILSGFGDGYMLYDLPSQAERDAVYALASRLGAVHLLDALAPDMSQGQLRLVLLARALIKKPRLLLLDEPCDGLDAESQKNMFSILEEICGETSIVCAIHKGEDIPSCLSHVMELEQGRITRSGVLDRERIFASAKAPKKGATDLTIGGAAGPGKSSATGPSGMVAPAQASGGQTDPGAAILTGRGKNLSPSPPPEKTPGQPVFRMENADVYLNRKKILNGINWEVRTGQQWLLSGANGSGKTTLLRVLLGEEHVALGGSLKWFGKETPVTLEERQRYTGYVSDWLRNSYGYDLTGRELVLSGLMGSIGFYRAPTPNEEKEADYWLARLGLAELAEKRLEAMSEGISRRFLLARALAPRPKLLILDEPCSGLDGSARAEFMRQVPVALEHGSQVIFVSHSKADLAGIKPLLTHELRLKSGKVDYSGQFRPD